MIAQSRSSSQASAWGLILGTRSWTAFVKTVKKLDERDPYEGLWLFVNRSGNNWRPSLSLQYLTTLNHETRNMRKPHTKPRLVATINGIDYRRGERLTSKTKVAERRPEPENPCTTRPSQSAE